MTTIDTDSTTDRANVLTEVRRVFASGRTRAPQWRVQQLRAIEQMCDEQESAIAAALASDLGRVRVRSLDGRHRFDQGRSRLRA